MIIAVTGGTGFVGRQAIARLVAAGHDIRALARRAQAASAGVDWVSGALDDDAALARLCTGADAVLHIAGVVNAVDAAGFDRANRIGTLAVLDAAAASRCDRFVHVSSLSAREPSLSLYGASKRGGEDAVAASGRDWRIVRPPAVYGPGDTEMLDIFRVAKRGVALLPPDGRVAVIHVDDLARLLVAMVEAAPRHAFYEPDDGRPGGWRHREFSDAIGAAVGRRVVKFALPKPMLKLGARIDRAARGAGAKLTADRVGYLCHADWTVDPARAVPPAVWTPQIETHDGLKATAQWYRAAGWL